jgi:hypothetical protein
MNMSHSLNRVSKVSLAAAVACLSTLGYQATASAANGVVPWLNQPAVAAAAPAAPAPAQHACAASDLKVVPAQQGVWRGYATQELRITNRSTESCYLLGAPSIDLHHPDAFVEPVPPAAEAQQRIDLSPDDDAYLLIGTPGACDAAVGPERKVATRVQLFPRGGGNLTLDGVHVDTLCGSAKVLQMEAIQDEAKQAAKAAANAAAAGKSLGLRELTAALTAPESVARGETLRYRDADEPDECGHQAGAVPVVYPVAELRRTDPELHLHAQLHRGGGADCCQVQRVLRHGGRRAGRPDGTGSEAELESARRPLGGHHHPAEVIREGWARACAQGPGAAGRGP